METKYLEVGNLDAATHVRSFILKKQLFEMPKEILPSLVLKVRPTYGTKKMQLLFLKEWRGTNTQVSYVFGGANNAASPVLTISAAPEKGVGDSYLYDLCSLLERAWIENISDTALPSGTNPYSLYLFEYMGYVVAVVQKSGVNYAAFVLVTSGGAPWVSDEQLNVRIDYAKHVSEVVPYVEDVLRYQNPDRTWDLYTVAVDDASVFNSQLSHQTVDDSNIAIPAILKKFFNEYTKDWEQESEVFLALSSDAVVLGETQAPLYYGIAENENHTKMLIAFVGNGTNIIDADGNEKAVSEIDTYYLGQLAYIASEGAAVDFIVDKTIKGIDIGSPLSVSEQFLHLGDNVDLLKDIMVSKAGWNDGDDIEVIALEDEENVFAVRNNTREETRIPVYGSSLWAFFFRGDHAEMSSYDGGYDTEVIPPQSILGVKMIIPPF